ncbi:MAG: DUF2256 domain-containing protein [Woeseiaceae bacterium]
MAHSKTNLPEKVCGTCGRGFTWRRKWAQDWQNVRYCSRRCRNERLSCARRT